MSSFFQFNSSMPNESIMRKLVTLYIFTLFLVPITAQVTDDFSDGDFLENPSWDGTINDFIVNTDGQLQLNAESAGQSSIYIPTTLAEEMEWQFFLNLNFNPSTSNSVRVYLQADDEILLNGSGYFLEIGESGNEDALKFYRQDAGEKTLLITATLGAVAISPTIRVRVTRGSEGLWTINADYSGGDNFKLEATTNDATYDQDGMYHFGFFCNYTATRTTDFFFDDIRIQAISEIIEDTIAPELVEVKILDEQSIELSFSEPLTENTATNISNYNISNTIGNPSSATLSSSNTVLLTLATGLVNQEEYSITINNIEDFSENILTNFTSTFLFVVTETAVQYDIIINEIMEDATIDGGGTFGLPAEEYVELYNRSNKTINLEDFEFSDGGSKSAIFPFYEMPPNSYLTIGKTSANALTAFGAFLSLSNFPTLSAEEALVLKNEFGELIDAVSYTQDWYNNSNTAGGGYSLERINPQSPCEGSSNWKGSTSFLGGTPGKENAVIDLSTAATILNIIDAYPITATQVKISFDKTINEDDLLELTNFSITNNTITNLSLVENNLNTVIFELQKPLVENLIETISIAATFRDCIGNLIDGQLTYPIALPVLAMPNDVIINEILFNPQTGGVDFVELYNRSEKVIDLNDLLLANQTLDNPQFKPIEIQQLLFPKGFVAFTESPLDIKNRYTVNNPNVLLSQDLPTFPDKDGNVLLYVNDGAETIFIDEFDYTADFHNALLNDENGVSLERINPDLPTQDNGNWNSASEDVGYATPTYQNSQRIEINEERTNIFSLSNNRISPDGDGFEDILQINYTTDRTGYSATIHIYDAAGRLIDKIVQNELLSTSGSFKWEGTTVDGEKANIGIYILWIDYLNLNGDVGQIKKAIVVAAKL